MAGSSIRRSKRLRRNAPNGGGGGLALIGAVVWYSRFLCFGAGMVFRFVYSFRWLGVGCPTGGVGYRGWVCVVHVLGDTDEVIQTNMLDNPPADNLESPPAVLPTTIQPDPVQDDSDSGLGGEDVQLFPELKIRGSPKHLAWPIKRFNACQKNAVRALGLGDMLDFQVEGIPKSMCRWLISNFDPTNMCLRLENGLVLPVTEEDVHYTLGLPQGSDVHFFGCHGLITGSYI
nr:uncharacterized protein LOC109155335 [Ipomoea batatas]GMD53310.1 uncharacterized protein LOC109155335 [Ipomoea batatas]